MNRILKTVVGVIAVSFACVETGRGSVTLDELHDEFSKIVEGTESTERFISLLGAAQRQYGLSMGGFAESLTEIRRLVEPQNSSLNLEQRAESSDEAQIGQPVFDGLRRFLRTTEIDFLTLAGGVQDYFELVVSMVRQTESLSKKTIALEQRVKELETVVAEYEDIC